MSTSLVRKAQGTVEPSSEDRTARLVLTTEEPDRVGDVVRAGGMSLDNYRANPVLLLGHDHKCLIGKTSDWTVEPGRRITAKATFHDETEEARQAWRLVKMGYLSGVSIGFSPTSPPVPIPPGERTKGGWEYPAAELMEVSLTAVPANPRALVLRQAVQSGRLEGEKLCPVVRKSLREALRTAPRKKEKAVSKPEEKALGEGSLASGGVAVGQDPMAQPAPAADASAGLASMQAAIEAMVLNALKVGFANLQPKSDAAAAPDLGGMGDPLGGGMGDDDDLFGDEEGEDEDDFDLGGEGEDDEGGMGDESEDEDEEDAVDRYRKSAPVVRKASPGAVLKSMKAHASCLKEAADHMGALGEMAPGSAWSGMHQSSCRYHATKMGELCKALAEMEDERPKDEAPAEAEPVAKEGPPAEEPASPEEIDKAISASCEPLRKAIYSLTGKRVG